MDLILYAVPFFLLAVLFELAWGVLRGRNTYRLADTINSLSLGTLSRLRGFLFLGIGGIVWESVARQEPIQQWPADHWFTWVVAFIAYDFCYYWSHRLGHEVNLLWAAHVAHHQSEEYNLSTALRQTSTGVLTFIFYIPMFFVGIPAEVVVTVGAMNLIYQFWVHTQHVGKLGPLEWVFITPSNHRVHHAQNERYLDRNYGGVFILWDRLFGTFQEERDDDVPVYGIRHALRSWNPLWANLHVYADCLRDSWRTRHWRDKVAVWLKGPAWRPADLAAADPRPEFDAARFRPYAPTVGTAARGYALGHFLLTTAAALALIVQGAAMAPWLATSLACACIASFVIHGWWLEAHRWALRAEILRLLGIASLVLWVSVPQPIGLDAGTWRETASPLVLQALAAITLLIGIPLARFCAPLPRTSDEDSQALVIAP